MNYLKFLAARIRDRIDPDAPDPADLDEVELSADRGPEAEEPDRRDPPATGRRVAKRYFRPGYDLSDRISDAATSP